MAAAGAGRYATVGTTTDTPEASTYHSLVHATASRADSPLLALLGDKTEADFPFEGAVLTIRSDDDVYEAFHALLDKGVLSAPVYDMTLGFCVGFIDAGDLVSFILQTYGDGSISSKVNNFKTMLAHLVSIVPTLASSVVNLSKNNPFHGVPVGTKLSKVAVMLGVACNAGYPVHRVPVFDPHTGEVTKVITQSAMLRYVHGSMDSLTGEGAAWLDRTVADAGLVKEVATVASSSSVVDALKQMRDAKLSAIGIVDDDGKLVGTVSNSDVVPEVLHASRSADGFTFHDADVVSFVASSRAMRWKARDLSSSSTAEGGEIEKAGADAARGGGLSVITCVPTETMRTCMNRLVENEVHRLYVVHPDSGKPVGVVSIGDVLYALTL